jgi:hypothetical protein
MQELERRTSSLGVNRIIYNDDGQLVERIIHDHGTYDQVFKDNQEAASNARFAANVRKVASIPQDVYDTWVAEVNALGYYDEETVSAVINFHLSNPDNAKFLAVGSNYRIKKNGF